MLVLILKRAQILVADIWGCYQGQGLGQFDDIDELTMFADYRYDASRSLSQRRRDWRLLES